MCKWERKLRELAREKAWAWEELSDYALGYSEMMKMFNEGTHGSWRAAYEDFVKFSYGDEPWTTE